MNNMTNEARIVWIDDIDNVDYVRMTMSACGRRAGRPRFKLPGRLLGYAEINLLFKPYVPGQFDRRVFWLKPYDRGEPDDDGTYAHGCPSEAVDPRTLERGKEGWITVRAWTGEPETSESAQARQWRIEQALAP